MNSRQRKTLESIFAQPVPVVLAWAELESLLLAMGAKKGAVHGFGLNLDRQIFFYISRIILVR